MKNKVVAVYKPVGQTPLEAVDNFRQANPECANDKIGYAGRLDPMADGLLLLLIGDENKNKDKYLSLDKSYVVQIVFGVDTDTHDLLGIVTSKPSVRVPDKEEIISYLDNLIGGIDQPPPAYSSYLIKGKPLFYYAKNNIQVPEDIPKIKRTVYEAKLIKDEFISKTNLKETILSKIDLVKGDFRQLAIKKKWNYYFKNNKLEYHLMITCSFKVSTGTYIRSIVNDMGQYLGTKAFALSITRTQIGEFV